MAEDHVITVAFTVGGEDRAAAEASLMEALPTPGDRGAIVEWWVAEDDRTDGSDNDSVVFVPMGRQAEVSRLLAAAGLTPPHNVVEVGR